ncbi:MAG TPA: LysM peptidoglycan-binding domain-containing protein [Vicinamibacterales bacterium]|nr:LysM peptidoglycan-binding domain-containing protein [Vicinamibacterales bacterium]
MATFDELKAKYAPALKAIEQQGVKLANLHVQDNKLFIKGAAPSDAAKNAVWTTIKSVDAAYADLLCDISIDPSLAPPPPADQSYTVQAGDTLSKISKQFYGDAKNYMKIFNANTDTLSDPDKIKVGQVLKIPAA